MSEPLGPGEFPSVESMKDELAGDKVQVASRRWGKSLNDPVFKLPKELQDANDEIRKMALEALRESLRTGKVIVAPSEYQIAQAAPVIDAGRNKVETSRYLHNLYCDFDIMIMAARRAAPDDESLIQLIDGFPNQCQALFGMNDYEVKRTLAKARLDAGQYEVMMNPQVQCVDCWGQGCWTCLYTGSKVIRRDIEPLDVEPEG